MLEDLVLTKYAPSCLLLSHVGKRNVRYATWTMSHVRRCSGLMHRSLPICFKFATPMGMLQYRRTGLEYSRYYWTSGSVRRSISNGL